MIQPDSSSPPPVSSAGLPVVQIRPPRLFEIVDFGEVWQFRYLVWMFGVRAVKARYKQSLLGIFWAPINPLISAFLSAIVFGTLAGFPSEGVPYPVFTFTAMLPWSVFQGMYAAAATSFTSQQQLVQKVYFPRVILPLATIPSLLINFGVQFLVMLLLLGYYILVRDRYDLIPDWRVVALVPIMVYAIFIGLTVGLITASLSIRYRDMGQVMGIVMRLWFAATPIAYSITVIDERLADYPWVGQLIRLNPLYHASQWSRWALLPGWDAQVGPLWYVPLLGVLLLFVAALFLFRRSEQFVADVI